MTSQYKYRSHLKAIDKWNSDTIVKLLEHGLYLPAPFWEKKSHTCRQNRGVKKSSRQISATILKTTG